MGTPAQGASGYYVWEAEESNFQVHVSLEAIDALGAEIMRGFGAVPKRGAEVGGILLGSVERGESTVVRIDDFESVPCGYTRGPSYLFAAEERSAFEQAAEAWRPEAGRSSYAVGYYRSHTRDGMALGPEDLELMERLFPDPSSVALLVRPFATKASIGGFFFREDGVFQETTPLEFPFRRRELTGEEPPERRPLSDRRNRGRGSRAMLPEVSESSAPAGIETAGGAAEEGPPLFGAYASATPTRSRLGAWMWFPLSFIFLLLGLALGILVRLDVIPRGASFVVPDYSLALGVLKSGDDLSVRWNPEAPAVRNAERGELEIHDGGYAKTVDLDAEQLRGGRVSYHNASDTVSFHLTVFVNSRSSVSEALEWRP